MGDLDFKPERSYLAGDVWPLATKLLTAGADQVSTTVLLVKKN